MPKQLISSTISEDQRETRGLSKVLAAVRLRDLESNAVVEEQLRRVAKPRRLGDLEVYHYGPQDRDLVPVTSWNGLERLKTS